MKKVDKLWNFVMEFIGTPVAVFIFLSWYTQQGKNNLFMIALLFVIAVVITAINYRVAFIEAIFGILIMFGTRQLLMKPIPLFWTTNKFTWFDQQTACAGVLAVFIVHLFFLYAINKSKSSE